ncbi:MAG TPA: sigma 54-interacting transcriptional regulator [Pirellulaceae bacterium]|nr:sigma 54-interacting transcriptional regulator [Pirellulaceae bacterium]
MNRQHMSEIESIPPITDEGELIALRAIVEGTADKVGQEFFDALVQQLAQTLGVRHAFLAEFVDGKARVRTRAFWSDGRLIDNVEYDLQGTPCYDVVRGALCHYPKAVWQRFPEDRPLVERHVESYLGVPLEDHQGEILGHLAIFDERAMPDQPRRLFLFRVFAARATAELLRLHMENQLAESEHRFRDLFDQAPIPYVYEDTETRFVSANQAAMNLLGLSPEDVPGTIGMTLVAQTPSNLEQLNRAFGEIRQGQERGLVELELRRKDNGQPIWVQFWSRPQPDGKHTRTIIIDITQRVLAERERAQLQKQNAYLQEEIRSSLHFDEIVGRSPALATVLEKVRAVAATDASVLITGETGTGKELIARAIHAHGKRRGRPLIKVNCAALPAGLIESELFGHEKGAFTGAIARRIGRFELADGGTIFLDEIGDLPVEMQAKLLRVLQERELERIGGQAPMAIDVRVIAATNRDLLAAIQDRTFREDLYYRLNVFPIHVPPLRERQVDIPLLASFFVDRFASQFGKSIDGIEPATLERLLAYPWPGNIRELQNVIERAAILSSGSQLEIAADVLRPMSPSAAGGLSGVAVNEGLEDLERQHIVNILVQTGWRIEGDRGAAKILGLNPNTLRSRMKKLGIRRPTA